MAGYSSERNLLLGIVALQMDFIGRDELIKAMHDWTLDKARSLSEILVQNGDLDPADRSVLESLVERHIARHGGDPEKSLSSLELIVPSRSTLESLDDPDIRRSLSKLCMTHTGAERGTDSERTASWSATDGETAGRFRIISLHDEGGLGSVFLARDGEVNRDVALKRMKEDIAGDPQYRARFVFEAEITGNLEHPGIVPVYGKGEYADGRPYYAMRFIRGDNLKVAVDRFHKDPALKSDSGARAREFHKLLRRFLVVCETMSYAHSRGIIHRDLKPRNILLGPYGETLVVDWGLAKVVGHGETAAQTDATLRPPSSSDIQPTSAGSRVGTPGYMSPEQARGEIERLGPASDIYSLGATLYYMLTKRPSFTDQDLPEVLLRIERGEFAPPREIKSGVDRALEAICLKAMSVRPEARYGSCRALADDLEHWLADQPVSAYREPFSMGAGRWIRRRRQWVTAAAAMMVIGLVGLSFHDRSLQIEKTRAEQARDEAAGQFVMTRTALFDLLDVAGTRLANIPSAEGLRLELAEKVLSYYLTLLQSHPGDADIIYETGRVERVIGVIKRMTGQFADSEKALTQAIYKFQRVADNRARGADAREWLAQTLFDRGGVYQLKGSTSLAEQEYRACIARSELILADGRSLSYLRIKGEALNALSDVLALVGQMDESRAKISEAVDCLERAATLNDKSTIGDRVLWLLAGALASRGALAEQVPDLRSAEADVVRSIEVAGRLQTDSVYYTSGQLQLATSLNKLGRFLTADPMRRPEARRSFDRAIQVIEPLAKESTKFPYYREALASAYAGRAALYGPLELQDAEKDCQMAESILTALVQSQPDNPDFHSQLADALEQASTIALQQANQDKASGLLLKAISHAERSVQMDAGRAADAAKLKSYRESLKGLRPQGRP